jgi:hypothetical protein
VSVVDDHQQRSIARDIREQVQHGHRDPEALGRRLMRQAKRGIQRGALHLAQLARTSPDGPQQLVQPRKRKIRLRLNTRRGQHRHTELTCRPLGHGQQARLADARLPVNHECPATSGNVVQQRRQQPLLLHATQQRHGFVISRHAHEHPSSHAASAACQSPKTAAQAMATRPRMRKSCVSILLGVAED